MAKMGKIFDNRVVYLHSSPWSGKQLAKISEIDWRLYWNKSVHNHLHSNFRQRVKQASRLNHVLIVSFSQCGPDGKCLGQDHRGLDRLGGRAKLLSTSLDLGNSCILPINGYRMEFEHVLNS